MSQQKNVGILFEDEYFGIQSSKIIVRDTNLQEIGFIQAERLINPLIDRKYVGCNARGHVVTRGYSLSAVKKAMKRELPKLIRTAEDQLIEKHVRTQALKQKMEEAAELEQQRKEHIAEINRQHRVSELMEILRKNKINPALER